MFLSALETVAPNEQGSIIRDALDPASRLPRILLSKDREHDPNTNLGQDQEFSFGFNIVEADTGANVGKLALAQRPDTGDYHMADIYVDPTGRGYGMAAYVLAIEMAENAGRLFVNDRKLTVDSLRMWERLIEFGVAEQFTPFVGADPGLPFDQQMYYTGDARIDPSYL
jgi:hypothetical protein